MQNFPTTFSDEQDVVMVTMPPMRSITYAMIENVSSPIEMYDEKKDIVDNGSKNPPILQESLPLM